MAPLGLHLSKISHYNVNELWGLPEISKSMYDIVEVAEGDLETPALHGGGGVILSRSV